MAKHIVDHAGRAKAAWPVLVHRARSGLGPISYGDLCEAIGVHHRAAAYFLGVICLDSWDHVPLRSWPLFKARDVLRTMQSTTTHRRLHDTSPA